MAGDRVRHVRLLEPRNHVGVKRELLGGHGVVKVLELRGPHDRRGHAGLVQEPGESDLCRGHAAFGGNIGNAVDDGEVELRRVEAVSQESVRARVVRRSPSRVRLPASRPRASGLQGNTATPWSMHCGIISRSSSR